MVSQCYPRTSRLICKAQFDPVFKQGVRRQSEHFRALVLKNTGASARLGTIVSRKISTKAVRRNLIKRQIREHFRKRSLALHGLDIVVLPQQKAGKCSGAELYQDLNHLFNQLQTLPRASADGTIPPLST